MSKNLNPLYIIEGEIVNKAAKSLLAYPNAAARDAAMKSLYTKGSNLRNQLAKEMLSQRKFYSAYGNGNERLKAHVAGAVNSAVMKPVDSVAQSVNPNSVRIKRLNGYLNNTKNYAQIT